MRYLDVNTGTMVSSVHSQRRSSRKGIPMMLKRPLLLFLLIAMVATAASCIFDPDKPTKPDDPPPVQKFLNLTEMWHVLNNIEVSYNQRNIGKYEELLDDDFT